MTIQGSSTDLAYPRILEHFIEVLYYFMFTMMDHVERLFSDACHYDRDSMETVIDSFDIFDIPIFICRRRRRKEQTEFPPYDLGKNPKTKYL